MGKCRDEKERMFWYTVAIERRDVHMETEDAACVIRFWMAVMEDETAKMQDRLKASENLARVLQPSQDSGGEGVTAIRVVYEDGKEPSADTPQ